MPSALMAADLDDDPRRRAGAAWAGGRRRPGTPAGPVHARAAESRQPLPVALRRAARGAIGIRVPALAESAGEVLRRVGVVVSTSANIHGGPDARRLEDVPGAAPAERRRVVDGGELPGTSVDRAST